MRFCCLSSVLFISVRSGLSRVCVFPAASSVASRCGGKNRVFRAVERSFASERTESSPPKSSCVFGSVGLGALTCIVGERANAVFDWLFGLSVFFVIFALSYSCSIRVAISRTLASSCDSSRSACSIFRVISVLRSFDAFSSPRASAILIRFSLRFTG